MLSELLSVGPLAYVGLALLPTPPSPVPDGGLQFLFALVVGLVTPDRVLSPFSRGVRKLGQISMSICSHIPVLRGVSEKVHSLWERWVVWIGKKRESEHDVLNKIYERLEDELIIDRLIFGYIVSISIGLVLIGYSLLILFL